MMEEKGKSKADERFLNRIENARDLGTHGVITWTREELHER